MECNFKQAVKNHLTEKIHEQKFEGGAGANKTILMSGAELVHRPCDGSPSRFQSVSREPELPGQGQQQER